MTLTQIIVFILLGGLSAALLSLRWRGWLQPPLHIRWLDYSLPTVTLLIPARNDWNFLDLWDSISPEAFTDSPVHLNPAGSRQLSEKIWQLYENLKTLSPD